MPERDDFIGGTRGASLSWGMPGKRVHMNEWRGGLIIGVEKSTATDMNTRKPKFWSMQGQPGVPDPTRPVKERILTVVTEEKDPGNPVDRGIRSIYIDEESRKYSKNGNFRPGEEKEGTKYGAYLDALAEAGVPGTLPEVGGYFYLCLYGEAQGAGTTPRGLWKAHYVRPTADSIKLLDQYVASSAVSDDMGEPATQQSPFAGNGHQQPSAPPAPPQAPAPPQGQPTYQPPAPPPSAPQPAYAHAGSPNGQQHQSPTPPPPPSGPYR